MANYSYMSRGVLKRNVADTASTDDAMYRRVLEDVSEHIDNWCNRTFRVYTATKTFTACEGSYLDAGDLLAVTTLKTDEDEDLTYEVTWAAADYELYPYDATHRRRPYWRLRKRPNGAYSFPVGVPQGVQVVGKWGFWEDWQVLASQVGAAGINSSAVTLPVDDGLEVEVLDTLLIGTEQLYVTAVSGNNATVVRGVNGTTAAAHVDNDPISRFKPPGPIVEACGLQAARIFKRRGAPFGVTGTPDSGFYTIRKLDPDVLEMLDRYKLYEFGG